MRYESKKFDVKLNLGGRTYGPCTRANDLLFGPPDTVLRHTMMQRRKSE